MTDVAGATVCYTVGPMEGGETDDEELWLEGQLLTAELQEEGWTLLEGLWSE